MRKQLFLKEILSNLNLRHIQENNQAKRREVQF
jgi:hypothetical protein